MAKQDTRVKLTRRRHAASLKRELVERSLQPGASVSGIALQSGINANVLFRWRKLHLRAIAGEKQDDESVTGDTGVQQAVLLPVKVTPHAVSSEHAMPTSHPSPRSGVIEIDIGAARVRLRGAVDEASVRCVLTTLRAIA
jgi:transposase